MAQYKETEQTKKELVNTVILGVGNVLLGDEGVGVKVVRELQQSEKLPPTVKLVDGATGGFSLLPIFETYKHCKFIIVDAIRVVNIFSKEKNTRGAIYVIPLDKLYEANKNVAEHQSFEFLSLHEPGLMDVLTLMYLTSQVKIKGYLVGISILTEDKYDVPFEFSLNLSPEIEKKVPEIIRIIRTLI